MNNALKIEYVDAICGSGKSFKLKEHIPTILNTSEAIPDRVLLVVPTHNLANEFQKSLTNITSYHVKVVNESAHAALKAALSDSFDSSVVITTHECFKNYCYKATFDKELQSLLNNIQIFVDEIPAAWLGGFTHIDHSKQTLDNFPFMHWMKQKDDGLFYLIDEYKENLYKYWHESHTASQELKQALFAVLEGKGLLYSVNDKTYSFFAQTVTPIVKAAGWASRFVVMGAGVSRSEFRFAAENCAAAIFVDAPCYLQPDDNRKKHKKVKMKIVSVLDSSVKYATLAQLEHVFTNHLKEISNILGSDFIYASNRDKQICNFSSLALQTFEKSKGEEVSMSSYGLNNYQHMHKAAFLGVANLDQTSVSRWMEYAACNGWDGETLLTLKRQAMTYEKCYQFVSRCSIRNADSKEAQLFVVPDLTCAAYLKEHYFPQAEIMDLGLKKTTKGDQTYEQVQALKAKGLSRAKVIAATGLSESTVKRNWKEKI